MVSLRRRLLYITFILAFIAITPLISFYAAGYTIGTGFSLQKTGILILKTEPDGAKMYLNGKLQKNILNSIFNKEEIFYKTPAKLKNLKPGEYNVKIELVGYWPWEKKLTIKPGESTFAEDIYLFKIAIPVLSQAGEYTHQLPSSNNENIILISENKIDVYNTDKNTIKTYTSSSSLSNINNLNVSWFNNQYVIIGNLLFDYKKWDEPTDLFIEIGRDIQNITWGRNENNIIFGIGNQIVSHELSKNKSKAILEGTTFEYFIFKSNSLFVLQNEKNMTVLTIKNIDNDSIRKINLPLSSYDIHFNANNLISLLDKKYNILYIVDPFSYLKPFKETINDVKNYSWIDNTRIIYSNNFEIWTMNIQSYEKKLITRIGETINEIIWHPSNSYAIYTTEHNLYTIELDDREKYIITKLIDLDKIQDPIMSKKGNIIYFLSNIDSREGLYRLTIQ